MEKNQPSAHPINHHLSQHNLKWTTAVLQNVSQITWNLVNNSSEKNKLPNY